MDAICSELPSTEVCAVPFVTEARRMPLQHYLISARGPIPLLYEKHMFFGRADGNNIVVDDVRASRRHAELFWDGASFVLIDLNSSNGTFVNSQQITTHVLAEGDEIGIGMQTFKYREVNDVKDLETSFRKIQHETRAMVTAEMPAIGNAVPDNDFNGSLATMGVMEICQTLELGRRSGLLLVMNDQKEKGLIYFRDGSMVGAETGLLQGDDAALKILGFQRGSFSFRAQAPALASTIKQRTHALLLEAARVRDETAR